MQQVLLHVIWGMSPSNFLLGGDSLVAKALLAQTS